ncbi:MAG: hypothetical protein EOO45_01735 [Flavobacterium sp.]|nr:MAG: hypothetical protein EOO45_01735 [Flavobacterium sp.]
MNKKDKIELLKENLLNQAIELEILNPTIQFLTKGTNALLLENHPTLTSTFELFKQLIDFFERTKLMEAIAYELLSSTTYNNINSSKMLKILSNRKTQLSSKIRILRPILLNCIADIEPLERTAMFDSPAYSAYLKRFEESAFEIVNLS